MGIVSRSLITAFALALAGAPGFAAELPSMTKGETVYVPVYSHVLHGDQDSRGEADRWLLAAMLSIRNTDPGNGLRVRSIRYYDSNGKLVREYPADKALAPLATTEIFVDHKDAAGGSGANFLVVWDADKPINPPIIETVHTYFYAARSTVFISRGQSLHTDAQ
jgi:hypothetical protein